MSFLQPLLLWALPLAALPIIVHLLNLRRHRKVEWGAMMFLLQATQQRRGHTRLRHLLILLSRALAVAAILMVISRPMAGRWLGRLGGRPDTVIVLLDRSASMAQQNLQTGQSKRAVAIQRISSAIHEAGMPRALVLIESADREPQLVTSPAALSQLPETAATDGAANIPAMLQQCLDYIVANQAGRTDIWICSDLQATNWMTDGGQWTGLRAAFSDLKQPVRFHLLTYAERDPENLAVRVLKLQRQRSGDHDQLLIDMEVRREAASMLPINAPIEVIVDGARTVLDVELSGERARITDHVVPLDRQRPAGWGKVELPNDSNPRDNAYFFTYGDSIQSHAVVVSDEPGSVWPLRLAAAPPQDEPQSRATSVASYDLSTIRWQDTSVVLWQAALPAGDGKRRLQEFVTAGGVVVFFPCADPSNEEFLGVRWGQWIKTQGEAQTTVDQWRGDRGLLSHTDAGQPLPVQQTRVYQYRRIDGEGQLLARMANGHPLLLQRTTDRGGVYFCATLPQQPYSNLAREGIAFFALVQRAMRQGNARLLADQFGEIERAILNADRPPWQPISAWPEAHVSTEQTHVAGVYEEAGRLLARNRPASEDGNDIVSEDQIDRLWSGLNYRVVQDNLQSKRSLVAEIWRGFVGLLLIALIVEAALCLPDVRPQKFVAT